MARRSENPQGQGDSETGSDWLDPANFPSRRRPVRRPPPETADASAWGASQYRDTWSEPDPPPDVVLPTGPTPTEPPPSGSAYTEPAPTGPTQTGPTQTGPTQTGPTQTGPTTLSRRELRALREAAE